MQILGDDVDVFLRIRPSQVRIRQAARLWRCGKPAACCRTSSLPNMPRALTEDWNNGAIVKFCRPSGTR